MRAAYLILAHNNPAMIRRLVTALQCDGASFYIHVDGKVGPAPFVEVVKDLPHVQFVEPVRVQWGGFSLVEATLRLMHRAHNDRADRYTLLSGPTTRSSPMTTSSISWAEARWSTLRSGVSRTARAGSTRSNTIILWS